MFTFPAHLTEGTSWPTTAHRLLGIIWSDPLQRRPDVVMPQSWLEAQWDPPDLGKGIAVYLFRPPPPQALAEVQVDELGKSPDSARLAVGDVVVVDDDGDGHFAVEGSLATLVASDEAAAHSDTYIAAADAMLVYVARGFEQQHDGLPFGPADKGSEGNYQLFKVDCEGRAVVAAVPVTEMNLSLDSSADLPEHRDCARTHRP